MYSIRYLLIVIGLLVQFSGFGQSSTSTHISENGWDTSMDIQQQKIIDAFKVKFPLVFSENSAKSQMIYHVVIHQVDSLQAAIAKSSNANRVAKIELLRMLQRTYVAIWDNLLMPSQIAPLIDAYLQLGQLVQENGSILPVIQQSSAAVGSILLESDRLNNLKGYKDASNQLVKNIFIENPENFFRILYKFPEVNCADSLLKLAARKLPEDFYTFSQARASVLGIRIAAQNDGLERLIVAIASSPNGRLFLPFLDDLYTHKIDTNLITNILNSKILYYKLLVKTQLDYLTRQKNNDTPVAFQILEQKLHQVAIHDFVQVVNKLHAEPDPIRLKVLNSLNPEELYFLCIHGADELYTSSFLKIYHRLFQINPKLNSYVFLKALNFDHFKRFLKLCTNFNTLNDFLGRMNKKQAEEILFEFVNGLNDKLNLDDAVDVAETYASTQNQNLRHILLEEISSQLTKNHREKASNPTTIYDLLQSIFLSLDSQNHIDLSKEFGIPPVFQTDINQLKNDAGSIVIQQLFYGDQDGQTAYRLFFKAYKNPNWTFIPSKLWVEFVSKKAPIPIRIFANLPLDDNTNQAEFAQKALSDFLKEKNLKPSIFIHRGHSYYTRNSFKLLTPELKIVFVGSCGGFNNLNQVFNICPSAYVITSKQEGSAAINQPIINSITESLRNGDNLYWPGIWKKLSLRFKADKRFEDYIPPYQNLGALLIMTFNKLNFYKM